MAARGAPRLADAPRHVGVDAGGGWGGGGALVLQRRSGVPLVLQVPRRARDELRDVRVDLTAVHRVPQRRRRPRLARLVQLALPATLLRRAAHPTAAATGSAGDRVPAAGRGSRPTGCLHPP